MSKENNKLMKDVSILIDQEFSKLTKEINVKFKKIEGVLDELVQNQENMKEDTETRLDNVVYVIKAIMDIQETITERRVEGLKSFVKKLKP